MNPRPPHLARWLLRLVPLGDRRNEIESDLAELWELRLRRADGSPRRRYYRDVISLCRRGVVSRNSPQTANRAHPLTEIACDVAYAARLFRRSPGVVSIAVAGLGVAIGVGSSIFSILNAVAFQRVGIVEPSSAVRVFRADQRGQSTSWPYAEFVRLREASSDVRLEASLAETAFFSARPSTASEETVYPMFVSGGFFSALSSGVTLGRVLTPSDEVPGAVSVAVLNHAFWSRRLGADPTVVGREIWLNGAAFTVVGVSARGFLGTTDSAPALWAPLASYHVALGGPPIDRSSRAMVHVSGRIAPGVSSAQAQASLSAIAAAIGTPSSDPAQQVNGVRFYRADRRFNPNETALVALVSMIVLVVIGLIVLLACINVANLLLASAVARQREMSVRLALGAGRGRIVRQLLTESLSLGVAGGAIGLVLTTWLVPILTRVVNAPASVDFAPDTLVYLFLTAISLLAGVGAGLAPARHAGQNDLTSMLKGIGSKADGRARPKRLRATLIGLQAAGSLVFLVLAALLTRAMFQAARVDVGFEANRVLTVTPLFGSNTNDASAVSAYWNLALERARAVAGVRAAALSTHAPFGATSSLSVFQRNGRRYTAFNHATTPEYFSTLGLRVIRGRTYTAREVADRSPVAVISETIARDFFPGEDPIGQPLNRVTDSKRIIIGVVADAITARLRELAYASVYYPLQQPQEANMIVRTSGPPEALIQSLRTALLPLDSRTRLSIQPVSEGMERELSEPRAMASIASVLASVALALAVVGIYGVTAFAIGQRRQEIGVRMACGASGADILQLMVRDSLRPLAFGLTGGVLVALMATQVFSGVLYGLSSLDPFAFAVAVAVLILASVAAVITPTRRAMTVDPALVLREL